MVTVLMRPANINLVDLNLLRVFDALIEERSVTKTGQRLGLSQSAVSHSLSRLRDLLSDELFVRISRGVRPTPLAVEIAPEIHAALRQLQAALSPRTFDPANSERRFTLMAGAYTNAVLTPGLVRRLAAESPRSELAVVEGGPDILDQMDSRNADFVIGVSIAKPERVEFEHLIEERLVWIVRAGHPLGEGPVTLKKLVDVPHVVIRRRVWDGEPGDAPALIMRASWEDQGALENALRAKGLSRRIGVTVPDAYSAMAIVRQSDMAALVPERLVRLAVQRGFLTKIEPPYACPAAGLGLLYLRDRMAEPAIAWMRALIMSAAGEARNDHE